MGKGAKSLRRDKHDRIRASKVRDKRAAQARGEARKPAA
jgi:hypothetical protein